MANVMLGFANRIEDATLSLGSWVATLPQTNLQDSRLGLVARTSNDLTTSTKIGVTFPSTGSPTEALPWQAVGLIHHNLSQSALIRVQADPVSLASAVYDSGQVSAWGANYTSDQRNSYPWNFINVLPNSVTYQLLEIDIDDTANADGYVQAGRLFVGPVWTPTVFNMAHGTSIGWEVRTQVNQAISGAKYFERRTAARVVRFTVEAMSLANAMALLDVEAFSGIDKEVLFLYDPDDTGYSMQRQFLGHLRQVPSIEHPRWNEHEVTLEVTELLA